MSGKKGKKGKSKAIVLSLGEFLASDSIPDSTIVSAPRHDDDDDEYSQRAIVLPTCPRMARGPHVDPDKIPTSPPFTCHVANLPFEADETDIRKFFNNLNVIGVRLPMDRDGGRSKGYGYVEFATQSDLIEAFGKHEEMIRNRKIRIDLPGGEAAAASERGGGRDGYRREGGGRYGDRDGRGDERGERSQGVSDWRSAPSSGPEEGRGTYERGGAFSDRDRDRGGRYGGGGGGGSGGRFDDDKRGPSRADDEPWRRGGPAPSSGGSSGFEDRDRRGGGGGFGDRRGGGGGGFEDRRGGGGGGFEDRRGGGGFEDRRGGGYDDRRGGYSRPDDRDSAKERPKLVLKPRSVPEGSEGAAATQSSRPEAPSASASIFGAAKPVNTASKELEIENKISHKSPTLSRSDVPKATNADIFGAAKPVDTAAREMAIEEKLSGKRSPNIPKKEVTPKPAAADIFGAAKPVDTLSRELEIEKKLSQQPLVAESSRGGVGGGDAWRDRGSRDGDRGGRDSERGGRDSDRGGRDSDRGGRNSDRGGRDGDRGGGGRYNERRDGRGDTRGGYDRDGGNSRGRERNRNYDDDSRGYDRRPYDRDDRYPDRDGRDYEHADVAPSKDDRAYRNGRVDGDHVEHSDSNGVDRDARKPRAQAPKVERPEGYDSDEERFLKAQPKNDEPQLLSVTNKFSTLDFEEDMP